MCPEAKAARFLLSSSQWNVKTKPVDTLIFPWCVSPRLWAPCRTACEVFSFTGFLNLTLIYKQYSPASSSAEQTAKKVTILIANDNQCLWIVNKRVDFSSDLFMQQSAYRWSLYTSHHSLQAYPSCCESAKATALAY